MHNDTPVHRDPLVTAQALPPSFILGTATASAQVEGATRIGRRTPSVWDRFAAEPGRILDGSTTAVTADHYHRYREDVRAMKELGTDAYRLSLGWTRLQPEGTGPLDAGGVDFYDRLLDEPCQAGISPFVTLSHWDIPVQYEGGWLSRDTAKRLGDFAGLVAQRFADRVDGWITINEPATVTLNGYALDIHASGVPLLFDSLPTVHNQLLGHGLAAQALRAAGVPRMGRSATPSARHTSPIISVLRLRLWRREGLQRVSTCAGTLPGHYWTTGNGQRVSPSALGSSTLILRRGSERRRHPTTGLRKCRACDLVPRVSSP